MRARAVGVLTLVKRNHRDVRRVETRLIHELLVQHVLVDTRLVVVTSRPGDVESFLKKESKRFLVRCCHGAVDLSSTEAAGEIFGVLEQHAADAQPPSVRRVNNEGADLGSPLFLVDDVDNTDLPAIALGNEHVLPRRKLTNLIMTARDVRIKDTPRVRMVVAIIEWAKRLNHEVGDEIEVVRPCGAHDDVID